jgi:hypothetical protein
MIASVSLSIDYIGGHSLVGPLNRLQNALSFNYYANTEMYDVRADSIDASTGKVVDGIKLGELKRQLVGEENLNKYINSLKKEGIIDQEKENEKNENSEKNTENTGVLEITVKDKKIIIVKTKDNKEAAEVEIDGKKSEKNQIIVEFSANNTKDEVRSQFTSSTVETTIFDLDKFKGKIIDFTTLSALEGKVNSAKTELDTLKAEKEINPSLVTNSEIREAENKLKNAEKELEKYKSSVANSINVTAYLSKNKKTTTVNKSFTITEEGLN